MTIADPFAGPAPAEVQLTTAPLALAIAQVRFPPILALDKAEAVADFQEAIRADYPDLRKEEVHELAVTPGGMQVSKAIVWKFTDGGDGWHVALTTSFVALETRAYSSRSDFLTRFDKVVRAAAATFKPTYADRLGLRYVNRLSNGALGRLGALVRPEVVGAAVATPFAERIRLNMTETQLDLDAGVGQMLLRHGLLPPQATYDPAALPPTETPSWVLDIDTYRAERADFNGDGLARAAWNLADNAYRMFRWIVRDEFLREHGAEI
ncbi:TIGR04255 family protein [Roseomonas stagni]|uniref:TIGR04255 family protein n=1 Tax=Falsiroseomonas algicola TaxID=2716930 RepID=A0A6M1LTQ2_9PROT|nr:TIGR04255 family protein [Falsiroseomonas algicola]NGM23547.1 TIGR04255 family protein [Falsiroseomonas algicola]